MPTEPSDPPSTPRSQAPALPFENAELHRVLRRPAAALHVVLAERRRLAASIGADRGVWPLVLVLTGCTLLAAIPYGIVLGASAWWKVTALFGGSVLLCYPSLQVFGSYLGSAMMPVPTLALSLVISAVAALFTLGFAPILWFLRTTMEQGDLVDAAGASTAMLGLAGVVGLVQLGHCVWLEPRLRPRYFGPFLLPCWLVLVALVTWRMARALDLVG